MSKAKKPIFKKKDGSDGPGRLFLKKGESEADAKTRLSEKFDLPETAKFDKSTNSFVPEGKDAAFKKRKGSTPTKVEDGESTVKRGRGRPKKTKKE
jgi:hypothetical protein